jgi:hypothetical protein
VDPRRLHQALNCGMVQNRSGIHRSPKSLDARKIGDHPETAIEEMRAQVIFGEA